MARLRVSSAKSNGRGRVVRAILALGALILGGAVYAGPVAAATSYVPVGSEPHAIVLSPDGSRAYVTNFNGSSISVIDTATKTVVSTISVGSNPSRAVISPDGTTLYVTNFTSNTVSVISTATNAVTATIVIGAAPTFGALGLALSPDGSLLYVTNADTDELNVISTATNAITSTVATGVDYPTDVIASPDGATLYIAGNSSNNVVALDATTFANKATIATAPYPLAFAINADGSRLYVATEDSPTGTVEVIDTDTDTVAASVALTGSAKDVTLSSDGSTLYVAGFDSMSVVAISTDTNAIVQEYNARYPIGVEVSSDGVIYYTEGLANDVGIVGPDVADAPTGVVGTPGDRKVRVDWTAPTLDGGHAVTDYVVEYSSDGGATWTTVNHPESAGTSLTVKGLTNGTDYVFHVAAVNSEGTGAFSVISGVVTPQGTGVVTVPEPPTDVVGSAWDGQVELTWTEPDSDGGSPITNYVIQYSVDGTNWITVDRPDSADTWATVTGLTNGTPYIFRVAAVNAVGASDYSSSSSSVTPTADQPVPVPSASGSGGSGSPGPAVETGSGSEAPVEKHYLPATGFSASASLAWTGGLLFLAGAAIMMGETALRRRVAAR